MTTLEQASAEIILLHEQIETWFRGDASSEALDALLACFADTFQMVTIRGDRLELDGVRSLFARLGGARPGMTISVDQVAVIAETATGWLVTYRETQMTADGTSNQRHSAAWLQSSTHGRLTWLFLQETAIP
jgi:hypothetical protein